MAGSTFSMADWANMAEGMAAGHVSFNVAEGMGGGMAEGGEGAPEGGQWWNGQWWPAGSWVEEEGAEVEEDDGDDDDSVGFGSEEDRLDDGGDDAARGAQMVLYQEQYEAQMATYREIAQGLPVKKEEAIEEEEEFPE